VYDLTNINIKMKIEVSENELKEDLKLELSESQEQNFSDFIENNSDSLNQKLSQSIVKRVFNIFDNHLKVYLDLVQNKNMD